MGSHTTTATREEVNPKSTARREAQLRQKHFGDSWVRNTSSEIQQRVLGLPEFKAARSVACYLAQPREAQTEAIIDACRKAGKRLAVPAYQKNKGQYGFAWLEANEAMAPGAFGILEPKSPRWAQPGDIDLLIVPCVTFDKFGRRLGHGGGHFDRLMGRYRGLKVCLAFEAQRVVAVPTEPHDVGMDLVVTEKEVVDSRSSP